MQCEYYALEGLSDLVQTIRKVRAHLNPKLEIEGLLRTMFDPRNTLAQNVASELEKHFGDKLYRTVIPRNIRLAEAPSHGIPVLKLELMSKGAQSYLALAGEIVRRMEARGLPSRSEAPTPQPQPQCTRPGNSCSTPAADNSQAWKFQPSVPGAAAPTNPHPNANSSNHGHKSQ